jgi:hypothetical protein
MGIVPVKRTGIVPVTATIVAGMAVIAAVARATTTTTTATMVGAAAATTVAGQHGRQIRI